MRVIEVTEKAEKELKEILGKKPEGVISIRRNEEGWNVQVEILEKERIPDTESLIGIYELEMNQEGEIEEYKRISKKKKGETTREQT